MTSSTRRIERDWPMVSGTAVWGKTTRPRSGKTGKIFGIWAVLSAGDSEPGSLAVVALDNVRNNR